MKTNIIIFLLIIGYSVKVEAQTCFDNGGFEIWEDKGGYSNPKYWHTLNALAQFGFEPTTIVSAASHQGANAALLLSTENAFQNLPGILASGPILDENGQPDFSLIKIPFAARPKSMSFYFKYIPGPSDSCNVYMALTKWNSSTQTTDTIGEAVFSSGDTVSDYRKVTIEFEYYSSQMPDSAMVIIASSFDGFDPVIGSALYIDDFSIEFNTGIPQFYSSTLAVTLYPNPTQGQLQLTTSDTEVDIAIVNSLGQTVWLTEHHQTNQPLDLSVLANGLYMIQITSSKGSAVAKFIKQN